MKKLLLGTACLLFSANLAYAEECPSALRDVSTAQVIGSASIDTNFDGHLETELTVYQDGGDYIGVDSSGKIYEFDRDQDLRFDYACVVTEDGEFLRYDVTTVN